LRKVLIANRGEIAVRIARGLREAELTAVAIYSDADSMAHHVRAADEAYRVGPAPAIESYLDAARILDIALRAGCDAIHPGYGFLAENAEFARACTDAGLTFIGPPAAAIDAMGHKVSARKVMQAAGVPVVPGGEAGNLAEAKASARAIGYPIMLKPVAGGGGKGMRKVASEAELELEWETASQEAARAFADGAMYLEKYLESPRHVEVQVLGDQHGNVVHLFERDCSVQRRHQKIIEEAPCPVLTPALAEKMGTTSVEGARALGYFSAGTFEYLLDQHGNFYFLEMNTRLQVEHPVTEATTGIDLVQAMLAVADGRPLPFAQSDIQRRGHAIECRIYAERPELGFLPSPGPVERMVLPQGPGIRNDEGAESGDTISGYYDPLIAKLIAWGSDRQQCIKRMQRALGDYVVAGTHTNLEYLRRVLAHPLFFRGDVDTSFVERAKADLERPAEPSEAALIDAVAAAALFSHARVTPKATGSAENSQLSEWVRQHRSRS